MPARFLGSVRTRALVLLVVVILPFVVLGLLDAQAERVQARERARGLTAALVADVMAEQEDRIRSGHLLLKALARTEAVQGGKGEACDEQLRSVLSAAEFYVNAGVADLDGWILCSAIELPGPVNIADRPYFQRALDRNAFAVGDHQVGRVTGVPSLNLALPVPDASEQPKAVLFLALSLSWLSEQIQLDQLPENSSIVIVDGSGRILARQPEPAAYVGRVLDVGAGLLDELRARPSGSAVAIGIDERERFFSYQHTAPGGADGGVYVAAGVPTQGLYAEAEAAFLRAMATVALVGALGTLIGWIVIQTFVLRPMDAIFRTARALEQGDLKARTGLAHLQSEFGELARQMDAAAAALQRTEEAKSILINNTAHELLTPVTVLRLAVVNLRNRLGPDVEPQLRRVVDQIERNVERLAGVAEQVLEAAALRSGRTEAQSQRVELDALLAERLAHWSPRAAEKGVTVRPPAPSGVAVEADQKWLAKVLDTVLDNALRFTPPGGHLDMAATALGGEAVITVHDTGQGIDPERLPQLFDPLSPAHDVGATTEGGLGLGLYISRAVLRLFGGSIDVASAGLGHGTTVMIRLRLASDTPPREPRA